MDDETLESYRLDLESELVERKASASFKKQICRTICAFANDMPNYKKPGVLIEQGDEYGFIRFGSRVDLFLPPDAKVSVKLDDKPIGGKTIIATL